MRFHAFLLIVVLSSLAFGCGGDDPVVPPQRTIEILTTQSDYSKQVGNPIEAILVNLMRDPVYILSCHPYTTIEIQEPEGWRDLGASWYPICLGPSVPVPIAPGKSVDLPSISSSTYRTWPDGTYRLRVEVYGDETAKTLLPERDLVSAPFAISE